MTTFGKKGDHVYHKSRKKYGVITNPEIFGSPGFIKVKYDNTASPVDWCIENLTIVDNDNNPIEESTSNIWSFPVQTTAAIDWELMLDDLSRTEPILLIEFTSEMETRHYIAIHKSLLKKAYVTNIPLLYSCTTYHNQVFLCPKHFGEWVEWAKKVYNMPWNEKHSITTNVSVKKITL